MRNLVCKPHGNEFWVEAEAMRLGIDDAGKVFHANKGNPATVNDKFAGVSGANADHHDNINFAVDFE